MERTISRFLRFAGMAFFLAAFAFIGCSEDSPNTPDPDPDPDPKDTTKIEARIRPVVFVHGAMDASDVFTHLIQLMKRNGYTEAQTHAEDFELFMDDNGVVDVENMSLGIQNRVDALIASSGEARVDLIAHAAGARAVQHYLAVRGGTAKIAQVVYVGPDYDLSINVGGDLTPPPCKYLTLRSNGKDALQNGNSEYGSLVGAQNEQLPELDNRQLISSAASFTTIFSFLAGRAPTETKLPVPKPGQTYAIKGRVIDFIDNTGVANASVIPIKIRRLADGDIQRQVGGAVVTTDANGYFSYNDVLAPDSYLEFLVRSATGSHYDMHIYRQAWRDNSSTERLRVIPRAGGSSLLTMFSSALRTGTHSIAIVFTQNQVLHHGRDQLLIKRFDAALDPLGDKQVLTPGNAPAPGAAPKNTTFLCLLDYDLNQQDGTGPIAVGPLNMFAVNSFDLFLDASSTNYQTQYELNNLNIATFNYRSNGASGSNNSGINLIQYEYVP